MIYEYFTQHSISGIEVMFMTILIAMVMFGFVGGIVTGLFYLVYGVPSMNIVRQYFMTGVLFLIGSVCAGLLFYYTTDETGSRAVPLSTIDNKITVQDTKVIIDPLDENYGYIKDPVSPKLRGAANEKQIFEFTYDEYYDQGSLKDKDGNKMNLTKEDTNYLKSRQNN